MAIIAYGDLAVDFYPELHKAFVQMRRYFDSRISLLSSGANGREIVALHSNMVGYRNRLARVAGVPGLVPYVADQVGQPAYDISVEAAALSSLIDAAISRIEGFNVNIVVSNWDSTGGGVIFSDFTSAQVSDLRTDLQAISAAILITAP